jgi:WD40 repeat protein
MRWLALFPLLAAGVCLARAAEETTTFKGYSGAILSLQFSPDGKTLASGSTDETVRLWDTATGKERATLKGHRGWVNGVAFSPDGKVLAAGVGLTRGAVWLWDPAIHRKIRVIEGMKGAVRCLAFSPDGRTLAVGGEGPPPLAPDLPGLGDLRLWDVEAGEQRLVLKGYTGIVGAVAFAPDGKRVAAGDEGCGVTLWATAGGEVRGSWKGIDGMVNALAFTADGKTLALGSADDAVRLWDLPAGRVRATRKAHRAGVCGLALSKDGMLLASCGGDRTVRLWDVPTGKWLLTVPEDGPVWSVAFSPDGATLAAGVGNTVKLRDVARLRQRLEGNQAEPVIPARK